MNLRPFSDTPRQSTTLCAVLQSALRLTVVALMVSGCSLLGGMQPGDPMLSTLVNQSVHQDGPAAETTEAKMTTLASRLVDAPAPMTAVDSLFFSANQAALVVPSAPLDAVVALLEANPAGLIVLEGHADTGEVAASALSWRRAQGARDYLLERGVPGSRVRIRSQGASRPSSIATREAGAQNRRVTLLLKTDNS